jgi:hypothetical protein
MNYLFIILMIILLYLNSVNSTKIVLKLKRTDSNKIILKLRRTDNYELPYNFKNLTTVYTKYIVY